MTGAPAALVVAQMQAVDGVPPLLLTRPRSQVLHLHRPDGSRRARPVTAAGVLRPGRRLLCGRAGRRWYMARVDGRRLCQQCERAAAVLAGQPTESSARLVPLEVLVASVVTARSEAELSSVQQAACFAGVIGRRVEGPDGLVLLTRLIAQSRARLSGRRVVLTSADHALGWRLRPAQYPRRVR